MTRLRIAEMHWHGIDACGMRRRALRHAECHGWELDACRASRPSYRMAFDGEPGANEGTILPDGGCPGHMLLSRRWVLAKGAPTIDDDQDQPLAALKRAGGRFKGTSTAGMPVTLTH